MSHCPSQADTVANEVNRALIAVVVIAVVLTGLPLLMGMAGMPACPDCGPALLAGSACALAILAAGATLLFAMIGQRLPSLDTVMRLRLHPVPLERPPQLA